MSPYTRLGQSKEFDYATLYGALAAFGLVFFAIFLGGGLPIFIEPKSLLIVVGGTLGATLINFPLEDFLRTFTVIRPAFFPDTTPPITRVKKLVDMAKRARRDGALTLEQDAFRETDSFAKKCIELAVDGVDPDETRRILEIEFSFLEDRHRRGSEILQAMGTLAPAMGLIGTLIGLVQMLNNLSDPSAIGPAMALALLSTFYGAVLAHLVFLPLAGKLRARSKEEMLVKEMMIEGTLAIVEGKNHLLLERRLLGFLAPEQRSSTYGP